MNSQSIDILWVIISACLVFLMQAGFLCLEAGATRRKNNINVVVKNIADLGVSVLCFWLFGFGIMFGNSSSSWLSVGSLIPDISQGEAQLVAFFLFQVMFCSTAVTIVSGAVAERMRFSSYILVSLLVAAVIYPTYGKWAWNGLEQDAFRGWLGRMGFVDFAGSTVVHSIGGWVALATVILVGPRIGRFSSKRRHQSLSGYDMPLALLGVLLLWLGWFGFNGGSTLALNQQVPIILTNTLLAGSAGLMLPIGLYLIRGKPVPVSMTMNGSLAGLVAITANCHVVSGASAVVIGAIGSAVMLLSERWLRRCRIDDVVSAIPVHLGAGIWGTLAVALFGNLELVGTGLSRAAQFRVQLLGIGVAGLWAFGIAFGLLSVLNRVLPMRVSRKQEQIGLNVAEHGATSDLMDLFTVMRKQERSGSLELRAPVEPFTLVGQIAGRYNRMMNALEQATARNEAIVQTATEAIVTVSKHDLRVCTANPAVRHLFGISEAQIYGQPITALVKLPASGNGQSPPDTMAQFLNTASADNVPYEMIGRRRGGSTFPIETTVAVTKTRQEDFYTLILRDITLRVQAEEAIQDAEAKDRKSRQLEQTLRELQNTQLQLVHSEKMSSLGQLVAGVAHEINNPVGFIYGNLPHAKQYVRDLLRVVHAYQAEHPDASEELTALIESVDLDYLQTDLDKLLNSMEGGAQRITEIVKSLRDFSRLGGTELKTVNIHEGIESTLTILRTRLKATAQRPEIYLVRNYGNLPAVECYASQLNQVFMNLLSNAIDALDEKANSQLYGSLWMPQIMITTELMAADWLQVQISDNGTGIPEEVQQRMLDPFFTTKPVGKGTGLGMSISYKIVVDHHGGQLQCASKPKRGTRFFVKIPLRQKTRPASADSVEQEILP